ncbi:hypothetical protein DRH29_01835 [candidate division Kazan bacterium]|uniref:Uncharacterized protein n=1 Tax=candidate division Kazan bacterium TaxID=2202143 RepID=A0A420ZDA5_UNCK3|nr:MAG: hypothetical protein DRH29_01835 [candidate division Kazan bacterium]
MEFITKFGSQIPNHVYNVLFMMAQCHESIANCKVHRLIGDEQLHQLCANHQSIFLTHVYGRWQRQKLPKCSSSLSGVIGPCPLLENQPVIIWWPDT